MDALCRLTFHDRQYRSIHWVIFWGGKLESVWGNIFYACVRHYILKFYWVKSTEEKGSQPQSYNSYRWHNRDRWMLFIEFNHQFHYFQDRIPSNIRFHGRLHIHGPPLLSVAVYPWLRRNSVRNRQRRLRGWRIYIHLLVHSIIEPRLD
jgi:hypothetical protein